MLAHTLVQHVACADGETRFIFGGGDAAPRLVIDLGARRTVQAVTVRVAAGGDAHAVWDGIECRTATHLGLVARR